MCQQLVQGLTGVGQERRAHDLDPLDRLDRSIKRFPGLFPISLDLKPRRVHIEVLVDLASQRHDFCQGRLQFHLLQLGCDAVETGSDHLK